MAILPLDSRRFTFYVCHVFSTCMKVTSLLFTRALSKQSLLDYFNEVHFVCSRAQCVCVRLFLCTCTYAGIHAITLSVHWFLFVFVRVSLAWNVIYILYT